MDNGGAADSSQVPTDASTTNQHPRQQLAEQLSHTSGSRDVGSLFSQLSKNPFFTAGLGLAALGTGLRLGQQGLRHGAALLRRRLLVDIEITRHDKSYPWFLQWMSYYQRMQLIEAAGKKSQGTIFEKILQRLTPGLHHLSIDTKAVTLPNGATQTNFSLVPGPGRHVLRYKKAFIAVSREREKGPLDQNGTPFETVKLTTLYSHRRVFEELFQEAHELSVQAQEGKTIIYTAWSTNWQPFGQPKRKRPLESVALAEGVKERIVQDIDGFLQAREWYLDRGIPYRRGYLLWGPPGTGKSSFIQALAGHLDFNIAMLHLSERGLTDDRLMHLLSNVPPRSIVLLEDADAAFGNRRSQRDADGYQGANVTYSGLLNALDGVASAEERIVFLTTNHVERLDEALVRPGRVDLTVKLGDATLFQAEQLWDRFFRQSDSDRRLRAQFVSKMQELDLVDRVSTATLQGVFLFNKTDPEGAIRSLQELVSKKPHNNEETLSNAG
ncbi:MAG: hypothetical protein M1828_000468 [Chrysothrix sp. TS-e1954]|nr:MAG: hypothetical protein M1828_000468 [Chrysothrix sp. TS-e1954]